MRPSEEGHLSLGDLSVQGGAAGLNPASAAAQLVYATDETQQQRKRSFKSLQVL